MTWIFRVAYETEVGESLWVDLAVHSGGNVMKQSLPMRCRDAGNWELEVETEIHGELRLEYAYVYKRGGMILREAESRVWECNAETQQMAMEPARPSNSCSIPVRPRILFLDDWRSEGSEDRVYAAKVFAVVEGGELLTQASPQGTGNHELNLFMARVPEGQVPCVLGESDALGHWDYHKAIPMVEVEANRWQLRLNLPTGMGMEYKYGLYSCAEGVAVKLENGRENRILEGAGDADFVRVCDECFRRSAELKFRASGVAIPVFSLRSEKGCGVGEFADLMAMADWAAGAGLELLQILPINDTTSSRTWTDSYPYSAISVFALHPIYMRLDEMSYPLPDPERYRQERDLLNQSVKLDYEAVMDVKWRTTREIFESRHDEIMRDPAFLTFTESNRDWILDYGVFCVKRDEYSTASFSEWGKWAEYSPAAARTLVASRDVQYFVWLQHELHLQLSRAVSHMHSIGVALKGDLPIGVDRESVDAWVAPHLFKMDAQTGAPPDAFAVKGQNWGFPTYDWDEMAKDGYAWWRSRFAKLSHYFDAYRIDHILGFFRIWQVPAEHLDGIMGWFDPALPVTAAEFSDRGIVFDYDRFCQPFIRESMLKERFGDFAEGVRNDFLSDQGMGCYRLKEDFSTQTGILDFFGKLGPGDWANKEWLREGLMELVGEVLFFEVPGSDGTEFHPRMSMTDTRSFKALDPDLQWRLRDLYEDYFYRRQESFWEANAYGKLPAMRAASDMLLCGEDLGMVPACVSGVMQSLGILSLEIQRWPKVPGSEFFHPAHAPYMSVVATGTHDMATLRGWWREDEQERARFAWNMFGVAFPEDDLSTEMARRIIEQHLWSPAMWAIFPLQDLLAMDGNLRSGDIEGERINIPAITPFYWRWRMEETISGLASHEDFSIKLLEMVTAAGR